MLSQVWAWFVANLLPELIILFLVTFGPKISAWFRRREVSEEGKSIASAFDTFTLGRIQLPRYSIKKIGRINRREVDEIRLAWEGGEDAILLIGKAGSGKSGIANLLAYTLVLENVPTLFVRATEFQSSETISNQIKEQLGLSKGLVSSFQHLGREMECVLIVDQLDSIVGSDILSGITNLMQSIRGLTGVRILGISRNYEATRDKAISDLGFRSIGSTQLTTKESIGYLQQVGINQPHDELIEISRNLLNLSLVADVASGREQLVSITDQVDLWEKYIESIEERETRKALETALNIAKQEAANKVREFSLAYPPSREVRRLQSREILLKDQANRYRFRHETFQDFLCAYALQSELPSAEGIVGEFGGYHSKGIIKWLHRLIHKNYPDYEEKFIDEVLSNKDIPFFTRAVVLDVLREQTKPLDDVSKVVSEFLFDSIYARYFFDELKNPVWAAKLHTHQHFLSPPEPIEKELGMFNLPFWFAGKYLVEFAEQYPLIVQEVALNIETKNPRPYEDMLDALLKIDPEYSSKTVRQVSQWLENEFDDILSSKVTELAIHLIRNGFNEGIQLVELLFTPFPPAQVEDVLSRTYFHSEVQWRFSQDAYWVQKIWSEKSRAIFRVATEELIDVFEKNLLTALDIEQNITEFGQDEETNSFWRSAIEPHEQNFSGNELKDSLIDDLRDTLDIFCEQRLNQGFEKIKRYLESRHTILQRIAIHTLRKYGDKFPALVIQVIMDKKNITKQPIHHEYFWLMHDQFGVLSQQQQIQYLEWLYEEVDNSRIEESARKIAQGQNRKITAEDRQQVREIRLRRRLWSIRDYLPNKYAEELREIVEKHDEPDHPDFLMWSSGVQRVQSTSPISEEQIKEKSIKELVEYLIDFNPEDSWNSDTVGGLVDSIKRDIKVRPEVYVDDAHLFINDKLRVVYISAFIQGLNEVFKQGQRPISEQLFVMLNHVSEMNGAPPERETSRYDTNVRGLKVELARFLEDLFNSGKPFISDEAIQELLSITLHLLQDSDPSPEAEREKEAYDPVTRSLNSVRGLAMHALIACGLYSARKEGSASRKQPLLNSRILSALDEKLDKETDASLTVHSVFGWHLAQLMFLDSKWVRDNISRIFPEEDEMVEYWWVAWLTYLSNNKLYSDLFALLRPQYQRAIANYDNIVSDKSSRRSPTDRLAQHILLAYIEELIDFDSDDELMAIYHQYAPDEVRRHGVFWFGQVLKDEKPDQDHKIWLKAWELWNRRLDAAEAAADQEAYAGEMNDYMRWLLHIPIGFESVAAMIERTLPFIDNGGYEARLIVEYLSNICGEHPVQAVELHSQVLQLDARLWLSSEDEEKILRAALNSKDEIAIAQAVDIINLHGERGNFQYKELLP